MALTDEERKACLEWLTCEWRNPTPSERAPLVAELVHPSLTAEQRAEALSRYQVAARLADGLSDEVVGWGEAFPDLVCEHPQEMAAELAAKDATGHLSVLMYGIAGGSPS